MQRPLKTLISLQNTRTQTFHSDLPILDSNNPKTARMSTYPVAPPLQ